MGFMTATRGERIIMISKILSLVAVLFVSTSALAAEPKGLLCGDGFRAVQVFNNGYVKTYGFDWIGIASKDYRCGGKKTAQAGQGKWIQTTTYACGNEGDKIAFELNVTDVNGFLSMQARNQKGLWFFNGACALTY